jgi:hypothetical protein
VLLLLVVVVVTQAVGKKFDKFDASPYMHKSLWKLI